jgi:hypothetical protein
MLRRCLLLSISLSTIATAAQGQSLRDTFIELFTFGDCGVTLCLGGASQLTGHGNHFIPAATAGGQSALGFVTNAIAINATNVPVPSTGGGAIFEFVDGLPVRTNISAGPIFAERAQTLGRGRLLTGFNATAIQLNSVRGIPMDNLLFNFGHQDIPPTGLGSPSFENDLIQVRANLNVSLFVATAYVMYGLLNNVDIGFAVPYVNVRMSGTSTAAILPIGGAGSTLHLFDGTAANPVLVAVSSADASASGVGDIAARLKIGIKESGNVGIGVIGEVRFPTGNEDDLLGSGDLAARGMAVISARFGDFNPHLNAGYFFRKSDSQSNTILGTIGFDQLLSNWATMAVDFVSEWQVGDSPIGLGAPIVYSQPFARTVPGTIIPERRDDLLNGSVGFKFSPNDRTRIIMNALVPVGNGGVQPTTTWTAGLEFKF